MYSLCMNHLLCIQSITHYSCVLTSHRQTARWRRSRGSLCSRLLGLRVCTALLGVAAPLVRRSSLCIGALPPGVQSASRHGRQRELCIPPVPHDAQREDAVERSSHGSGQLLSRMTARQRRRVQRCVLPRLVRHEVGHRRDTHRGRERRRERKREGEREREREGGTRPTEREAEQVNGTKIQKSISGAAARRGEVIQGVIQICTSSISRCVTFHCSGRCVRLI
jgi:hypothetical protein